MADPVVIERLIDSTPDEAFAMFTEPERLRRWQTISAAVDLRVGGDYRFTCAPGHIATGTFTEIEPGKRLVYTWDWNGQEETGSTVVVELEPKGDQTLVRLTHEGLSGEQAVSHAAGWEHFADRLVDVAQKGDAGADPWAAGPGDVAEFDPVSAAEASWAVCQDVMRSFTPAHRELQTPCEEFTVHNLVEHLMESLRSLSKMGGGEIPDEIDASSAEDYIGQAAEVALATWRSRGVDGEVQFGDGTVPAFVPVGILSLEFLLHAWDFAQATDQAVVAADPLVEYVQAAAEQIIRPDNRGPGKGFAEAIPVSTNDPMIALAAFTGRRT